MRRSRIKLEFHYPEVKVSRLSAGVNATARRGVRQPKLNPRQEAHLVALHRAGEHSTTELADLFSVARSTVYRAIQREAAAQVRKEAARSSR